MGEPLFECPTCRKHRPLLAFGAAYGTHGGRQLRAGSCDAHRNNPSGLYRDRETGELFPGDFTPVQRFRAPDSMWQAFANVCRRRGVTMTDDLVDHLRRAIRRYGDEEDRQLLVQADEELRARRSRKGGRPPLRPPDA